jgi:hypothetical protein
LTLGSGSGGSPATTFTLASEAAELRVLGAGSVGPVGILAKFVVPPGANDLDGSRIATSDVVGMGNDLQVIRITAQGHPAAVIQLGSIGYRPNVKLIAEDVGIDMPSLNPHRSVAISLGCSTFTFVSSGGPSPDPASMLIRLNLG